MLWYIYYGYMAYNAYSFLEYGYLTMHYVGKVYTWLVPAKENGEFDIDTDWVFCNIEDNLNVVVLD